MKMIVDATKCPQDHACPCIPICPRGAIRQENIHSLPQVDAELCVQCRKCIQYCPKGAFELKSL